MDKCIKCGSSDIDVQFIRQGDVINSSSQFKQNDEFVRSSEYDYFFRLTAKKDHLKCRCKKCGFFIRNKTMDDKS